MAHIRQEPHALLIKLGQLPVGFPKLPGTFGDLPLEMGSSIVEPLPLALKLLDHRVEPCRDQSQLISLHIFDAMTEVSALYSERAVGERPEGLAQRSREQISGSRRDSDQQSEKDERTCHQQTGYSSRLGLGCRHFGAFICDCRRDQFLKLGIEAVLDFGPEQRDRLRLPALLVEQEHAFDGKIDLVKEPTHLFDPFELAPLLLLFLRILREIDLLAGNPPYRRNGGNRLVAGALEIRPLGLADQQKFGDLLGIAIGIDRQAHGRFELLPGELYPVEMAVGGANPKQGSRRHRDHREDDNELKDPDPLLDAHRCDRFGPYWLLREQCLAQPRRLSSLVATASFDLMNF